MGLELGVAGWKAQMNPPSYGGTPLLNFFVQVLHLLYQIRERERERERGESSIKVRSDSSFQQQQQQLRSKEKTGFFLYLTVNTNNKPLLRSECIICSLDQ